MFLENERQFSTWKFEVADTDSLFAGFKAAEAECQRAIDANLPLAAYDQAIEASHVFNLLNARGVISVAERQAYIGRVRDLAKASCAKFIETQTPVWQAKYPGWVA